MAYPSLILHLICLLGLTLAGARASASDDLLCQLDTFPTSIHYSHSLATVPMTDTFSDGHGVIATIQIPDRDNMILTLEKGQLKAQMAFKSYDDSPFEGTINLTTPGPEKSLLGSLQCLEVR